MRDRLLPALALAAVLALAYYLQQSAPESTPVPAPAPAPAPSPPSPCPGPGPCPKPRPWGPSDASVEAVVSGRQGPDGTEILCDLPGELHLKNCGGSDGSGLCVFTSISHSARWQNVEVLADFRDWMKAHPGGGYPKKVDDMIARCCQEKGQAKPDYLQVEGTDLDILRLACRTGRMPGVTYSFSPSGRYGGQRIAHMVSLPHADEHHFAVLDNNYPGADKYEWLTPEEFKRTYTGGHAGWAVILLAGPPPMPPHNGRAPRTSTPVRWASALELGPPAYTPPRWRCAPIRELRGAQLRKACSCSPQCTCGCNQGRPCTCEGAGWGPANYGVRWDQVAPEKYSLNGQTVSRAEAVHAVAGQLADDSAKLRLTVIGTPAERLPVIAGLGEWRDKLVFQGYAPDHWVVRSYGFSAAGHPTIYVQAPDGQVLHRQDGYTDAEDLARALRQADPNYRPAKDPDLTRPLLAGLPIAPDVLVGGAAAALVLLALLRPKKEMT